MHRLTLSSPQNAMAVSGPAPLSRFSAKFSRASGKNWAPGIFSASASTRSPRVSAITPQKSQTLCQNFSGSAFDHS